MENEKNGRRMKLFIEFSQGLERVVIKEKSMSGQSVPQECRMPQSPD